MKRLPAIAMSISRWLPCIVSLSALGCSADSEITPAAAGSWAALAVEVDDRDWVPRHEATTGTSVWLEPLDLSTGLDPEWLHLGIGLHNRHRAIKPGEVKQVADSAQLVRWPEGSVIPSKVEVQGRKLDPAEQAGMDYRSRVGVVPGAPLEPGWYALTTGPGGLVSRFHVGSCPILIGLSWCDGIDGMAVVFSEPVSKNADVEVFSEAKGKKCEHRSLARENRTQSKSMRRYVRCDLDPEKETARIEVGDVVVGSGQALRVPAASQASGVSALDIAPSDYRKVDRCSHARVPLSAPLPHCP